MTAAASPPGQAHRLPCAVCGSPVRYFASDRVLGKYDVDFVRCPSCGLIALPEPGWLEEAYSSTIYEGDTGLLRRCRVQSVITSLVIRSEGIADGKFLDWAGGYGTLTRMMRDKGYDFYTSDPYVTNVLAKGYDGDVTDSYSLVTAFEVLEHLVDPVAEMEKICASTDRVLVSTLLQPERPPLPSDWWYYQLDSGQHVALYTEAALREVGRRLGYEVTSNGHQFHLFHRGPVRPATRAVLSRPLVKSYLAAAATARGARSVARLATR